MCVCGCVCVCVCEREESEKVEAAADENHSQQQSQRQQRCHKYHLIPALTSVLQQKHIEAPVEPVSTWAGIETSQIISVHG